MVLMIDRPSPQRGVYVDACHLHSPHRALWLSLALIFSIGAWFALIYGAVALVRRLLGS
jgi:hypothetical protein